MPEDGPRPSRCPGRITFSVRSFPDSEGKSHGQTLALGLSVLAITPRPVAPDVPDGAPLARMPPFPPVCTPSAPAAPTAVRDTRDTRGAAARGARGRVVRPARPPPVAEPPFPVRLRAPHPRRLGQHAPANGAALPSAGNQFIMDFSRSSEWHRIATRRRLPGPIRQRVLVVRRGAPAGVRSDLLYCHRSDPLDLQGRGPPHRKDANRWTSSTTTPQEIRHVLSTKATPLFGIATADNPRGPSLSKARPRRWRQDRECPCTRIRRQGLPLLVW